MKNKKVVKVFGKNHYYLGTDANGINYWLQEASWDCDWYWGGGYVHTFTNNKNPALSKDINSHNHFNLMFLKDGCGSFKDFFVETPFSDSEIWKILELMQSFYIARKYSDMLYSGSAHLSSNPVSEVIKSDEEYKRINKVVIPAIMNALYKIMSEKSED
jgi:hypothetical protein